MDTQFITNGKGEKTAVILPMNEYEDLVHQYHLKLELTDEYKTMIDDMLKQEKKTDQYLSLNEIKARFEK